MIKQKYTISILLEITAELKVVKNEEHYALKTGISSVAFSPVKKEFQDLVNFQEAKIKENLVNLIKANT